MRDEDKQDWLSWAKQIQAIFQSGLTFSGDPFDIERYEQLQALAAEMMSHHCDTETAVIHNLFTQQTGYAPPRSEYVPLCFTRMGLGLKY